MIACSVDLETTGTEATDEIVEIGSYLIEPGGAPGHAFHCLIAPSIPIPPTASAVHHIVDQDLVNAPPWAHVSATWYAKICGADVMVAHNARFEQQFLGELTAPKPWVCTMKCAMRAWPDAPGFGNQVLRYWRNPSGLDRGLARESHRALPDAYVTAFLFRELLSEHPLETLIQWSAEIPMPPRVAFGKHKGVPWSEAPVDFLKWIAFKSTFDADTKAYAEHWIKRREPASETPEAISLTDGRAAVYLRLAEPIVSTCDSAIELGIWWRNEAMHRAEYGIVKGTTVYDDLVAMCAARKEALAALAPAVSEA